ncbi:MAG: YerC/YecD family TrpR-related protein [Oscillospiraceae bacterium]
MNDKLRSKALDNLFEAVLALDTEDECYAFFEDLCTVPELKAISQRYQVANLLLQNKVYNDIVKETGASTATISRVNRSLSFGSDGYKTILKKIGKI